MNSSATFNAGTELLQRPAPEPSKGEGTDRTSRIDDWLHDHLQHLVLAIIAAAFVVRIVPAAASYLNPDEALQYVQINQPTALLAYKAVLPLPHPPLYYLLLYFWRLLGTSELMLRLPSVFFGTALCWVTFKWIGSLFGRAAGLIGLVLAAFCPALIGLSAQMRQYTLLLSCVVASLYFLERAFQRKSVRAMWWFSIFLYIAILSHFSAFFFVVAAGLYCLMRIADAQLPRKVAAAWLIGQIGAVAIYVFLYVTQLSKLKAARTVLGEGFDQFYFHSYRDDIFAFTGRLTLRIFRYWFDQSYISGVMLAIFLAGVAFLFARDLVSRAGKPSGRVGILLVLPFVALWGAAIAGVYPYVPSRYTIFLLPFAMAASCFLLAALSRQKLWAGLLVAGALMAVAHASGKPTEPGYTKENQRRALTTAAVDYIQRSVPKGDLILVDFQSSMPLAYYLCGPDEIISFDKSHADFDQFRCKGYTIVSLRFWTLRPEALALPFEKVVRAYGLKPGDSLWIFQTGWWGNMVADQLPKLSPDFRCLDPKIFRDNISVMRFAVGPDLLPAPWKKC